MYIRVNLTDNMNWPYMSKFRGCHEDIAPFIMHPSGRRYTGFDSSNDALRKELEAKMHTDLSANSEFWDTFFVRIGEDGIVLDPDNDPYDMLKWIFLKNHPEASTSGKIKDPTRKFVIHNEEEEAEAFNKAQSIKRKMYAEAEKLSMEDVRNVLRIFNHNPDNMSSAICQKVFNEILENKPKEFAQLWVDNPRKQTYILLNKAIQKGIIKQNRTIYLYNGEPIGNSLESTIYYLDDEQNIETRQGILLQIEGVSMKGKPGRPKQEAANQQ